MFSLFGKESKEDQLKKRLFDFLNEMEKNMEIFYVMDQRQFIINGFLTDMLPMVQETDILKTHQTIVDYAQAVQDFNLALKTHKDYEVWYTGDTKNKTPENARQLHALKAELDQRLKSMEAIIIPAGQDLEREMLKLGLLKT